MTDPPKQAASSQTDQPAAEDFLQGAVPRIATTEERRAAMDQAFDYRGDVTIHTADGQSIQGYVFDRRSEPPDPYVRVMPTNGSQRVAIRYADITALEFSGRDTAAGKSWETWVKKYHEKKASGQSANLHPDPLDE